MMKFNFHKTANMQGVVVPVEIEINSLEELLKFIDECECGRVVIKSGEVWRGPHEYTIEDYNEFRE